MKRYKILILVALTSTLMLGCADLETENLNRADIARALEDADEFPTIINSQFLNLWHATQHWRSANAFTFGTVADQVTSSWGNFGMRDLSSEPRIAINNTQTYNYAYVMEYAYETNYGVIGAVNDVLRLLNDSEIIVHDDNGNDITEQTAGMGLFAQGVAYGNLALTYDKGLFVDETVDLVNVTDVQFSPYAELMTLALGKLDLAVTKISAADDFNFGGYNGVTMSRDELVQFIKTMQAKFMVYVSRTDAENIANDWSTILALANQGITSDFAPLGDGASWWSAYIYYGSQEGWARVDYRVINAMDNSQPSRFPTDGSHPLPPASGDNRLTSDMTYMASIPFRSERGLYHYSHYDYSRYDYHFPGATGAMPHTKVVENDLIKAEAMIRTGGDKAEAASLINQTRVTRGGLAAVSAADSDATLLDAVFHERFIELYVSMGGIPFYDRRRLPEDNGSFEPYSGLQPLSFRHLPISAKELNILGEELYTFGGQ